MSIENRGRVLKADDKRVKPWPGRFWNKVQKTDSCWLWLGSKAGGGYGICFGPNREKNMKASRASWELHFGPIPPGDGFHGTCVCHKCDNPTCVNPDHLFLGSMRDNALDMIAKGRAKGIFEYLKNKGPRVACPSGHPANEKNTRRLKSDGSVYCLACARERALVRRRTNGGLPFAESINARRDAIKACAQGHEWSVINILIRKNGKRECRVCVNERAAKYRLAKRVSNGR